MCAWVGLIPFYDEAAAFADMHFNLLALSVSYLLLLEQRENRPMIDCDSNAAPNGICPLPIFFFCASSISEEEQFSLVVAVIPIASSRTNRYIHRTNGERKQKEMGWTNTEVLNRNFT